MVFLIFLLILLGIVFRAMNGEERSRLVRSALATVQELRAAIEKRRQQPDVFRDALNARTGRPLVTPILVVLNVAIFLLMLLGAASLSDPDTLVSWGGNFGPRTTNGEGWRLVTTMFLHAGLVHLLVNIAALAQLGLILERLVGRLAFAAVYVATGVFASLASLAEHPMDVGIGASGAICGLYGLLLAAALWSTLSRSALTLPLRNVRRLVAIAAVFVLYSLANQNLHIEAEIVGLITGFIGSLVLTRGVGEQIPAARRVAIASAATALITVATALSLRVVNDVRPEIARVVAVEDQTASIYEAAVDRFRRGRITVERLVETIDRTIMPELQAMSARIKALDGVPPEHVPLVQNAEEYLRLRDQSWRLRAEGLNKGNMRTLRDADRTERESLRALEKIRTSE